MTATHGQPTAHVACACNRCRDAEQARTLPAHLRRGDQPQPCGLAAYGHPTPTTDAQRADADAISDAARMIHVAHEAIEAARRLVDRVRDEDTRSALVGATLDALDEVDAAARVLDEV